MLARKYDNYAWQDMPAQNEEFRQPLQRQVKKPDYRRLWRNRITIFAIIVISTYLAVVVRSEAMLQLGNQLVTMQQQEAQLINKNNELKIEVEQLKGPERIIGLAEQQLGMSVARSNIYVQAGSKIN